MVRQKPIILPSGLAIDFGGTKIAAARLVEGKIVKQLQVKTQKSANIETQIRIMADLLEQLDLCDADQIGLAATGCISRNGEWSAVNLATLEKIQKIPLQGLLSQKFNRPVHVMNDATAAAYGEYLAGAGQGVEAMGYITVSTGVGGGFVLDGKPLRSRGGLAGHVGFTTSRLAKDMCGSGRNQTIESVASGTAIAKAAEMAGHHGLDAKNVYQAHFVGQKWATSIIEKSAKAIAELCGNLKSLLDLDIVVLGGGVGLAEGYCALVNAFLQNEPPIFRPPVVPARLGVGAAFIGVLAQAQTHFQTEGTSQ